MYSDTDKTQLELISTKGSWTGMEKKAGKNGLPRVHISCLRTALKRELVLGFTDLGVEIKLSFELEVQDNGCAVEVATVGLATVLPVHQLPAVPPVLGLLTDGELQLGHLGLEHVPLLELGSDQGLHLGGVGLRGVLTSSLHLVSPGHAESGQGDDHVPGNGHQKLGRLRCLRLVEGIFLVLVERLELSLEIWKLGNLG